MPIFNYTRVIEYSVITNGALTMSILEMCGDDDDFYTVVTLALRRELYLAQGMQRAQRFLVLWGIRYTPVYARYAFISRGGTEARSHTVFPFSTFHFPFSTFNSHV